MNRILFISSVTACSLLSAASAMGAELEEIIVTAQKREQSLQDVPISLDVIGGEALRNAKIDTTIDLALATPSIHFQQAFIPLASSFGLRGINTYATSGGLQPSVSFVIDGVPIARVGEFQAELGDIERVEILRGPQGTLFGRNATAGAINVVRKKPTEAFEGYVEGSITDDDEYIVRMGVSGPITDRVRGRLAAYSKQLDDYIDNLHPLADDEGGEENFGLLGKLDIDVSDSVNVLLTAEYSRQNTDLSPSVTIVADTIPGIGAIRETALGNGDIALGQSVIRDLNKINVNENSFADTINKGIAADLTWQLKDGLTLKSISAYRSWEVGSEIDVDATPANPENTMFMPIVGWNRSNLHPGGSSAPGYFFETDYFSQELRLEGSGEPLDWVVGGFYQIYTDGNAQETPLLQVDYFFEPGLGLPGDGILGNNYYFFTDPVKAEAEWETWAAFGDVTWHITDNLNLFAGLRWTMEDTRMNRYSRRVSIGPAEAPFYDVVNPDFVVIDLDALAADPLWSLFQSTTKFKAEDRAEDWSGRIGASWDVTDDINVYITASRGFVGSGIKFGRDSSPDNTFVDPSIAESYELGLKADWLDRVLRTNLALFWTEVVDLQTSRLIPGTVQTTTFNAGDLRSHGLEANISWNVTDQLMMDFSATWMDTEVKDLLQPCYPGQPQGAGECEFDNNNDGTADLQDLDGKSGVMAPDLAYRALVRYDIMFDTLPFDGFAQVSYTWQDDIQFRLTYDPMTEQDAYGLTDIVVGIEDRQGRYTVSVFGKNIGDEEFVNNLDSADGVIGRVFGRVTRQARAYYGIRARYNF